MTTFRAYFFKKQRQRRQERQLTKPTGDSKRRSNPGISNTVLPWNNWKLKNNILNNDCLDTGHQSKTIIIIIEPWEVRIKWSESQECSNLQSLGNTGRSLNEETEYAVLGSQGHLNSRADSLKTNASLFNIVPTILERHGSVWNTTFQKRHIGEKIMWEKRSHMIEVAVTGLS